MTSDIERTVGYDSAGTYVEWFNATTGKVTKWYGSALECGLMVKPPRGAKWYPLAPENGRDAATATGMYDRDF